MKAKPSGGGPNTYEIRELRAADLRNGFVETMGNLSDTGGLTPAAARKILGTMRRTPLYHVLIAVGAGGGLFLEPPPLIDGIVQLRVGVG